jgi:hypothetical protein
LVGTGEEGIGKTDERGVLGTEEGSAPGADKGGVVEAGVDGARIPGEEDEGTLPDESDCSVCKVTVWGVGVEMRWRTNKPATTRMAPAKLQIQKKNFLRRCFSGMILCHMSAGTGEE